MTRLTTTVAQKDKQWTVTVESATGERAEVHHETEAQARLFAASVEQRPTSLNKELELKHLSQLPRPSAPRRR